MKIVDQPEMGKYYLIYDDMRVTHKHQSVAICQCTGDDGNAPYGKDIQYVSIVMFKRVWKISDIFYDYNTSEYYFINNINPLLFYELSGEEFEKHVLIPSL